MLKVAYPPPPTVHTTLAQKLSLRVVLLGSFSGAKGVTGGSEPMPCKLALVVEIIVYAKSSWWEPWPKLWLLPRIVWAASGKENPKIV